jgi:hypothetical protein
MEREIRAKIAAFIREIGELVREATRKGSNSAPTDAGDGSKQRPIKSRAA